MCLQLGTSMESHDPLTQNRSENKGHGMEYVTLLLGVVERGILLVYLYSSL